MKKTCGTCGNDFPKNKDYFFVRKIKQFNAKGELKIYNSFRSNCKKCHGIKGYKRTVKKKCNELSCNVSDYRKNWKNQYSQTRTFDLDAKKKLSEGQYNHFLILLKQGAVKDAGSYLKRVEESKKERNKRLVNEVLSKQKYFTDEDLKQAKRGYQKQNIKNLTDATVANLYLGFSVKDVTKEIIETKRILIKIKRELKQENYGH